MEISDKQTLRDEAGLNRVDNVEKNRTPLIFNLAIYSMYSRLYGRRIIINTAIRGIMNAPRDSA